MIVTFYSYKGGVGRSMAMANVARWFQLLGLNVVVIDFDLEAPGLESFFSADKETLSAWRSRVGLMDLLTLYRRDFPSLGLSDAALDDAEALRADVNRLHETLAPLRFSLLDVPLHGDGTEAGARAVAPGKLRLLSAGWREGPERFALYANAVQAFDWADFYASCRGQAYFEWLRESLCQPGVADIVLVDSRTGVTEMGGVCTRHLADVVTVLSAPNRQNIQGATMVARTFLGLSEQAWRSQRPVQVVMVPSRIDASSHMVKSVFEPMFREHTAGLMPESLQRLQRDFWDLRIPYVDAYAFEEKMAVGESGADPDLEAAYKLLAAHIAWLAAPDSRVQQALRGEFDRLFGAELVRAQLDVAAQFEGAWGRLPEEQRPAVRDLLLRLVQVADSADDGDRPRSWRRAEAEFDLAPAIALAQENGLVKAERGSDEAERLVLTEAEFIHRTALAQWITQDRTRLLWRQRLRTYLEDWQRKPNDPGTLLQGSVLEEAEAQWQDGTPLLAEEQLFIRRSRESAHAAAQAAAAELAAAQRASAAAASTALPAAAAATASASLASVAAAQPHGAALPAPPAPPARRSRAVLAAGVGAVALAVVAALTLGTRGSREPGVETPPTPAVTDPPLLEARRLAEAGDFPAALQRLNTALQAQPDSVPLRLARAEVLERSGDKAGAFADLDWSVNRAPDQAAPRRQRAQLRAANGDSTGALSDLLSIEQAGGALDLDGWALRAQLLAAKGLDADALAAYQRVLEMGDAFRGQYGMAQVHERRNDRAAAMAAYRAAADSATEPRQRTLAEARLQALQPAGTQPVTKGPTGPTRAHLMLAQQADAPLAQPLGLALERAGLTVPKSKAGSFVWEQVRAAGTRGDVRYFFREDQEIAQRARSAAQDALAAQGIDLPLTLQLVEPDKVAAPREVLRGRAEVWLPPVGRLRGLRVQAFVCLSSGADAQALAARAEAVLQKSGAIVAERKLVDEATRSNDYGVAPRGLEVRHAQSIISELLAANLMLNEPQFAALGPWRLVPTSTPTPGYVSLFVCPQAAGGQSKR